MSVGQLKQTPHYIDQLYFELRNTMKPISSPSNLSLPFETNKKSQNGSNQEKARTTTFLFSFQYKVQISIWLS
jgi:hypothetical protein